MQRDFIIIGGGVTGLSAAMELKKKAVIIERDSRSGGLVKSYCFKGGFWFDHVLHILHFKDIEIQTGIQTLLGNILKPFSPIAWIECKEGTTLYPFQLNLGALNEAAKIKCIDDYAKVYFQNENHLPTGHYEEFLRKSFGNTMCELFYFPYNNKLYKYPLNQIAVDHLTWNIHRPSFDEILQGAFSPNIIRETYNTNAFYPAPPAEAPGRGMELLTQAMTAWVDHINYNTNVTSIDVKSKTIYASRNGKREVYKYNIGCLSTIPLPALMSKCSNVPKNLLEEVSHLEYSNVLSVALSVIGPRPQNTGHWRYYTDSRLPFTRLIFMTEFDTYNAPQHGWGLLAEITFPAKERINKETLIENAIHAIKELGVINDSYHTIIDKNSWIVDPAYVIFNFRTKNIINNCIEYLEKYDITSLGRYGKWEYSSIYQNIKDGFSWAKQHSETNVQ